MEEKKKGKPPKCRVVACLAEYTPDGKRRAVKDNEGNKRFVSIGAVWQKDGGYPYFAFERDLSKEALLDIFENKNKYFLNVYEDVKSEF